MDVPQPEPDGGLAFADPLTRDEGPQLAPAADHLVRQKKVSNPNWLRNGDGNSF